MFGGRPATGQGAGPSGGAQDRPDRFGRPFPRGPGSPMDRHEMHGPFPPDKRMLMFHLMELPPEEVETKLSQWPRFREMSEEDRKEFVNRLHRFRDDQQREALDQARQLGIQVGAGETQAFVREYWRSRRKIEETLRAEMEPRRRQLEKESLEALKAQFGN